jgi:hypothetical protein
MTAAVIQQSNIDVVLNLMRDAVAVMSSFSPDYMPPTVTLPKLSSPVSWETGVSISVFLRDPNVAAWVNERIASWPPGLVEIFMTAGGILSQTLAFAGVTSGDVPLGLINAITSDPGTLALLMAYGQGRRESPDQDPLGSSERCSRAHAARGDAGRPIPANVDPPSAVVDLAHFELDERMAPAVRIALRGTAAFYDNLLLLDVREPGPQREFRLRLIELLVSANLGSAGIVQDAADEVHNGRIGDFPLGILPCVTLYPGMNMPFIAPSPGDGASSRRG